jgi:outer membrane protein assembly factor BamA
MLESNLRPLYEDLGRLTVAFPHLKAASTGDAAVAITAEIDEGPVWRLGKVDLNGEALPVAQMRDAAQFAEGAPANWKQFLASIQKMEQVLKRDGYIAETARPVRSFHDSTQVVDVAVEVSKGRQFRFGELHIDGLGPDERQRLAGLWKLPGGAVMNELYIGEFLHSVLLALPGKFKTVRSSLHARAGTNVVDVTITFR